MSTVTATTTSNKIVLAFGGVERAANAPDTYEDLLESVLVKFPLLKEHSSALTTHYVDNEGDEIVLSTDEELKEAYDVGSIAGTLHVKIVLPVEIHQVIVDKVAQSNTIGINSPCAETTNTNPTPQVYSNERVELTSKSVTINPLKQTISTKKAPSKSFVIPNNGKSSLEELQQVRETVESQVNHAFEVASKEIKRLVQAVSSKSAQQSAVVQELKDTKANLLSSQADLENIRTNCEALQQRVTILNAEIEKFKKKEQLDVARITELESQVRESHDYESKYKLAEQGRLSLSNQLTALKTGLLALAQEKK